MSNKFTKFKKTNKIKIPIEKSKHKYGIYTLVDNIHLPQTFGGITLLKNNIIFLPTPLTKNSIIIRNPISLEDTFDEITQHSDLTGKNVLIIRNGGIGDILASFFGIVELKRKFKDIKITYAVEYKYLELISQFKGLVDFPISTISYFENIKHCTHLVNLDEVIENNNEKNIQDVFADKMCVTIFQGTLKILHNYFTRNKYVRNGIGIQYRSNSNLRNYNIDNFIELINKIHITYPDKPIYLLGAPNDYLTVNYIQVNTDAKIICNGCGFPEYSILQSFDVIQQLELVIGCDSSMNHIAGLCKTPIIGLFGSFHSVKRISKYNNAIGINGKTQCSPCNRHDPQSFCPFTNGEGICVNSITPDLILNNVEKLIGI